MKKIIVSFVAILMVVMIGLSVHASSKEVYWNEILEKTAYHIGAESLGTVKGTYEDLCRYASQKMHTDSLWIRYIMEQDVDDVIIVGIQDQDNKDDTEYLIGWIIE